MIQLDIGFKFYINHLIQIKVAIKSSIKIYFNKKLNIIEQKLSLLTSTNINISMPTNSALIKNKTDKFTNMYTWVDINHNIDSDSGDERSIKCSICNKTFIDINECIEHIETHQNGIYSNKIVKMRIGKLIFDSRIKQYE